MRHIIGGYYLVEGTSSLSWKDNNTSPEVFWSISDCISPLYPHIHLLSWITKTTEEVDNLQKALQLSDEKFAEAIQFVDNSFNTDVLGWPGVWLNIEGARTFYTLFLHTRKNVKLLGIALPEKYYEEALAEVSPSLENDGKIGLYKMLQRNMTLDEHQMLLGYEILGIEYGGSFHSFVCNGLEEAYFTSLQISRNTHGLISSSGDAEKAMEYTNLDTTKAEPVLWLPWLVFEIPLVPVQIKP